MDVTSQNIQFGSNISSVLSRKMAAFSWPLVVFDFGYLSAVLFCLTLAVGYVASLYIRASRKHGYVAMLLFFCVQILLF